MLILAGFLLMLFMNVFSTYGHYFSEAIYTLNDVISLLFVVIPVLVFLYVTKNEEIMCGYIMSSFEKDYKYSKTELERIIAATKSTIKITLAVGILGFIIGLIFIFAIMDMSWDEATNQLFRNLAVNFIILKYSMEIGFSVKTCEIDSQLQKGKLPPWRKNRFF